MSKWNKIRFCLKASSGLSSFVKLLYNSKLLRWSKTADATKINYQKEALISLDVNGHSRPFTFRTYAGDLDIYYEIFFHEVYRLPSALFQSAQVIIDLGANIGIASLYFLSRSPHAAIIAVEPDRENYGLLHRNLLPEIQAGTVTTIQAAITDQDGTVSFSSSHMKFNSRISESEGYQVPALSMNTLLKSIGAGAVDILKMDIEGAEHEIFAGDVSWLKKVKNLIIEIHPGDGGVDVIAILEANKFKVRPMNSDPSNQQLYWASSLE